MGADEYFRCCETIRLDLLELLGKEYIVEHCIYELKKRNEMSIYHNYIAMTLYAISNNRRMVKTYQEVINVKNTPVDNRTGDEIAVDVISKCGLAVAN